MPVGLGCNHHRETSEVLVSGHPFPPGEVAERLKNVLEIFVEEKGDARVPARGLENNTIRKPYRWIFRTQYQEDSSLHPKKQKSASTKQIKPQEESFDDNISKFTFLSGSRWEMTWEYQNARLPRQPKICLLDCKFVRAQVSGVMKLPAV